MIEIVKEKWEEIKKDKASVSEFIRKTNRLIRYTLATGNTFVECVYITEKRPCRICGETIFGVCLSFKATIPFEYRCLSKECETLKERKVRNEKK